MDRNEFQKRTKAFALAVIRFVESLPADATRSLLTRQLLRSATSVGANYRAACRARSTADFVAKLGIVEEEADESQFWLELLQESGLVKVEAVESLIREADELTAMIVASIKRVRQTDRFAKSAIKNPKSEIS